MIEIQNIRKSFGKAEILHGIDLSIRKGSVTVVLGPSGSGKTTFLRCLNALEMPQQGRIVFDEHSAGGALSIDFAKHLSKKEILALRRKSGMVFQQYHLFFFFFPLENIIEGPVQVQKKPVGEAKAEGLALLGKVGLADKADLYPYQLSGGQQQRVGIARALAIRPELLLFDEPTSALDPELVQDVLDSMKALAADGWTMVVVTHEVQFALAVADVMLVMDKGLVVEQGAPKDLLANPQHERTRSFLQKIRH